MRNYQCVKNNPYWLPKPIYNQTIYAIQSYDTLKERYEQVLHESSIVRDGQPTGKGGTGAPTEKKALILAEIDGKISAISSALNIVPPEYRNGVLNNIKYYRAFPLDAGIATYRRHKQRFIYNAAVNLGIWWEASKE